MSVSQKIQKYLRRFREEIKVTMFFRRYRLLKLENKVGAISKEVHQLAEAQKIEGKPPSFYMEQDDLDVSMYDGSQKSPDVYLHEIENAAVIGRTEFVLKDGRLYYPHLIDTVHDTFMAELEGHAKISSDRQSIWLSAAPARKSVKAAISLCGQCNGNYLHFITETLARLALIESRPELAGVPLIIEKGLHPRLYEALDFLNVSGRELIFVKNYRRLNVDRLFYVTPPSYTPPETRLWFEKGELSPPRKEQFHFSGQALALLRSHAVKVAQHYVPFVSKSEFMADQAGRQPKAGRTRADNMGYLFSTHGRDFHSLDAKRFYCDRPAISAGNGRLVKNNELVVSLLRKRNFADVHLADYSFPEQVLFLQDAEIIVSPVGASLGNLIFCEPGKNVILLSPTYPGASFFYFTNLMTALGHNLFYVTGRQQGGDPKNRYNLDFWVPLKLLLTSIGALEDDLRD